MANWAETARSQGGAISRPQLLSYGLHRNSIDNLLKVEAIVPRANGVYLARGVPDTYLSRIWIAILATDGVVGFATGAHLWGCTDEPAAKIELVLPHTRRVEIPDGVRIHRVFTPHSCIQRHLGMPITTRRQTLLDHLGRLPRPQASRLADRALQRAWITRNDIEVRLRDFPGRTGNRTLRLILAQTSDGAAAESERMLHGILRRAGITGWKANYQVWHAGRLVAVVDVALVHRRIALEIDGWAYHSDIDRFQRDRERQNELIALGWTVLRFTWHDVANRPAYVLAAVRSAV